MAERPRPTPPRPSGKARDRERAALAELIEVERAIASLEGRNVENAEHLVAARRDAEERKAALERVLAQARDEQARRKRVLPLKVAAAVVGLGALAAGGVWVTRVTSAELGERSKAIDAAALAGKVFEPTFARRDTLVGTDTVAFGASKGACYVAIAAGTKGAVKLTAERASVTRGGGASLGWCSCKDEEVRLTAAGEGVVATAIYQAPADTIGGADGLAAAAPRPSSVFAETLDRACAEASFDAWLAGLNTAKGAPDPAKRTAEEKALEDAGLTLVGLGAADAPFVVAEAASDACFVAMSRGGGVVLRQKGGEKPASAKRGALGVCAKESAGWSFWRDGGGEIAIFRATRKRIGGLLGLREAAARAKVPIVVWTPPEELEADARAALVASGIPVTPGGPEAGRAAVVALSTDTRSTLTPSSAGPNVACRPALDVGVIQSLCLEGRPGAFDASGANPGVSKGLVPLWLSLPSGADRAALDRGLDLMAFSRRMSAEGFELTSLVGATLTADGAEITGRSGEKEIVALVVSSTKPFVHTLGAGAPWTLEAPQRTPLTPGQVAKLRASPRYTGAAKREFVVWRR